MIFDMTKRKGGGEPQEVPEGYTQLRYIKSSGAQYIDTGVAPTLETKMWAQGFYLEGNGVYYPIMGSSNPACQMATYSVAGGNVAFNNFGNQADKQIQITLLAGEQPPTIEIDKNGASITIAGVITSSVSFSATTMSGSAATHIALFGRGNGGLFERLAKAAIYRAKIYDNGVLIREFVPCIQKSNNEVGMYDIVNGVFYGNNGTGVFEGVEL